MKKFFKNIKCNFVHFVVSSLLVACLAINLFYLGARIYVVRDNPKAIYEPGEQFKPFRDALKGVKYVGYMTNKNVSMEKNDGFFLLAQYYFAPTIIRLNSPDKRMNIVDYTDKIHAYFFLRTQKIKDYPYTKFGQALVIAEEQ